MTASKERILDGVRGHLMRYLDAQREGRHADPKDAAVAHTALEALLGWPESVRVARELGMVDPRGHLHLQPPHRKAGGLLDDPNALHAITYEAAALVARGVPESEAFREIAKGHRGLTATRVRELYRDHYAVFAADLAVLPRSLTPEDIARERPNLNKDAVMREHARREKQAAVTRDAIVQRLERHAAEHWEACRKA